MIRTVELMLVILLNEMAWCMSAGASEQILSNDFNANCDDAVITTSIVFCSLPKTFMFLSSLSLL